MTTVTGADALNKKVVSLVQDNQSKNETNLVRSLNTNTTTDTNSYTSTDDKNFGEVVVQSTKKKTFGVYTTKQVVEDITPTTKSAVADKVSTLPIDDVTNLQSKSGVDISSDIDYDRAIKTSSAEVVARSSEQFSKMSDGNLKPSAAFISESIDDRLSPITGQVIGSPDYLSGWQTSAIATIPGEVVPNTSWKDLILENIGDVPTYEAPFSLDVNNYTTSIDPAIRSYVPDSMTLEQYREAQAIVNGDLADVSSCPSLNAAFGFDVSMFDMSTLTDKFKGLFDLGIDTSFMDCFPDMMGSMGVMDKLDIIAGIKSRGDIDGASKLFDNMSSSILDNPEKLVRDIGNGYSPTLDSFTGTISNGLSSASGSAKMDSLLTKAGVSKDSLFSVAGTKTNKNRSLGDELNILDTLAAKSSNPSNGFMDYALGSEISDLISALP